jgi:hypothetical protein
MRSFRDAFGAALRIQIISDCDRKCLGQYDSAFVLRALMHFLLRLLHSGDGQSATCSRIPLMAANANSKTAAQMSAPRFSLKLLVETIAVAAAGGHSGVDCRHRHRP